MSSISDKTRKLLWGRSGNRCAICRCELVMPGTEFDGDVIIGDECHINARNPGGPRWDPSLSEEHLDSYDNLILLCKVHHKVIDDQPNSYPVVGLKTLKDKHEKWLKINLCQETKDRQKKQPIAPRVRYGKDIISIVADAHLYDFDYDEPENPEEIEMISVFLQFAQDYGDLGDSVEAGGRVEIGVELTSQIRELENHGYWVFGLREQRNFKVAGQVSPWNVAVIRIFKKDNPEIIATSFQS